MCDVLVAFVRVLPLVDVTVGLEVPVRAVSVQGGRGGVGHPGGGNEPWINHRKGLSFHLADFFILQKNILTDVLPRLRGPVQHAPDLAPLDGLRVARVPRHRRVHADRPHAGLDAGEHGSGSAGAVGDL